jgi:pyruvate dehydrogenase E2 component (dihydrolipoyllysine-residue acetyltransferase)
MATEITMPKLSDTMTEGRLISWKKSVGEKVERGEIIAEVETDKATMELESFSSGVILEFRIKPGEMAPVGTVMALVGSPDEMVATSTEKPAPTPAETSQRQQTHSEPVPVSAPATAPKEPVHKLSEPEKRSETSSAFEAGTSEKASPLVRRLAREKGIDLAEVHGSGPEGRILREDLERTESVNGESGTGKVSREEPEGAAEVEGGGSAVQPLTRMRGAIARTVAEAWRTIPHFSVTIQVEMGEAERVRLELKGSGTPVSLNDFIVKAAATAIGKFPRINATFSDGGITMHPGVNIGIAVALDDGLLVPVIRGCEELPLREIASRSRELVKRAKEGKISEAEMTGGTFSISNLGMYGVDEFTAVIHPLQGAILAVGAVMERPVIKEGHLAAARMMHLTLSADHRLIDGAYAARFIKEMKRVLETPVTMLL